MVTATELFPLMPDSARLWTFGVGRPLSPSEKATLLAEVDGFIERWRAHGDPLAAGREWIYDRFLLVAVDDRVTPPSGCSIDALVHMLGDLESRFGTEIVGAASVWFRAGGPDGEIRRVSRPDFKKLAREGEVGEDTVVFDLALTHLADLHAGWWEVPARDTWHRRYLEGAPDSVSASRTQAR